jgi:hypothetical protein
MSTTTHNNPSKTPGNTDDPRREAARKYVQQRQAFRVHAGVEVASMAIIFIVNAAVNFAAGIAGEWWAWWSIWAFIGCSSAVMVHGLVVRLARPDRSGQSWEERQIDELLAS